MQRAVLPDLESVSGWLPRHLVHLLWRYHGIRHGIFRDNQELIENQQETETRKGLVPKDQRHVLIICDHMYNVGDFSRRAAIFSIARRQQDTRLSEDATCAALHLPLDATKIKITWHNMHSICIVYNINFPNQRDSHCCSKLYHTMQRHSVTCKIVHEQYCIIL